MENREGGLWHCINRDCDASVATIFLKERELGPRCVCGSAMQRTNLPPVFDYLSFLRVDGTGANTEGTEKEQ